MDKPKILVARAVFPEVIERLQVHFDVESNQGDEALSKGEFMARATRILGLSMV